MIRSSIASVALAAASVMIAAVACSGEGPATPSGSLDTAALRAALGSASAIPVQHCDHASSAQPLRTSAIDIPRPQPTTAVPLPDWLHLAAMDGPGVVCRLPAYTQQDNAVPLTTNNPPVQF